MKLTTAHKWLVKPFLISLWLLCACSVGAQAAEDPTAVSPEAVASKEYVVPEGKAFKSSAPDGTIEVIQAVKGDVRVEYSPHGILQASGHFILDITQANGLRLRIPKRFPSFSQEFRRIRQEPLFYTRSEGENFPARSWVALRENLAVIKGFASAEAIHPPKGDDPGLLVAVSGDTSETYVLSDLQTYLKFSSNPFPFWRAARADLDEEEKAIANLQIPDNRIGAPAYRQAQKDTLFALDKIRQGYQLLQRNLYSQKVIDRMLQEGIPIPRLTLAEVTLVRGDNGYSIRPFVNWKGEGRVLVDRVALAVVSKPPAPYSTAFFEISDLSNRMLEATRLVMDGRNPMIEIRKPQSPAWMPRQDIQFDFNALHILDSQPETFDIANQVDAGGYFTRKSLPRGGVIQLSRMSISKNTLSLRYLPQSADGATARQFSNFIDLKRILYHPDLLMRSQLFPESFKNVNLFFFINDVIDEMVQKSFDAKFTEITGLEINASEDDQSVWTVEASLYDEKGRVVQSRMTKELKDSPRILDMWNSLDKKRDKSSILDLKDNIR